VDVGVADYSFTPSIANQFKGGVVRWNFTGPSPHTVTDASGMQLFDSQTVSAGGTFVFAFPAAGTFKYRSTLDPSMTGTVKVPMSAVPGSGDTTTPFTISWASAPPPPGYVYDVQVVPSGSTVWSNWQVGVTGTSATFTATNGTGKYSFRSRIRKATNSTVSGWSASLPITVS
jgi:hypothetical protein